jgi:hypothetical protein
MRLSSPSTALTLSTLLAAGACTAPSTSTTGTGGATTTTTTSATGTGDACTVTEAFGACTGPTADGGPGEPGSACQTSADCTSACCPCPHGQTLYAYAACNCGRCASVCDPTNDTRAPVCQDAGPVVVGCLSCSQILNEALAEGEQLGPLACAGAAASHWEALTTCVTTSCGSVCPTVTPTNACVSCFEQPDAMGGCATEAASCVQN